MNCGSVARLEPLRIRQLRLTHRDPSRRLMSLVVRWRTMAPPGMQSFLIAGLDPWRDGGSAVRPVTHRCIADVAENPRPCLQLPAIDGRSVGRCQSNSVVSLD
jgi:hypothetical protein